MIHASAENDFARQIHAQCATLNNMTAMERESLDAFPIGLQKGMGYKKARQAIAKLDEAIACLREAESLYHEAATKTLVER